MRARTPPSTSRAVGRAETDEAEASTAPTEVELWQALEAERDKA